MSSSHSAYHFAKFPTAHDFAAMAGIEDEQGEMIVDAIAELLDNRSGVSCDMATMAAFAINNSILSWQQVYASIFSGIPTIKGTGK